MANNVFMTLISTNDYIYGCVSLMYSWKKTQSKYPFYCLVTPQITKRNRDILEFLGYSLIEIEDYVPDSYWRLLQEDNDVIKGCSKDSLQSNGWQHAWNKFHMYNMTQFDKICYIDADVVVLQNIDDIFNYPGGTSAEEWWAWSDKRWWFLAGILIIEPNTAEYERILQFAEENPIIDGELSNDMKLLNKLYSDWGDHFELHLPEYYFVETTYFSVKEYDSYLFENLMKIRILHLSHYMKPWQVNNAYFDGHFGGQWETWAFIHKRYIAYLNQCLEDLHNKGWDLMLIK